MEINVVELIVQAGALGALVLLLVLVGRYGNGVISRLMDNLDTQTKNNATAIVVQEQVASAIQALCGQMNGHDDEQEERSLAQAQSLAGIIKALEENTAVLAAEPA